MKLLINHIDNDDEEAWEGYLYAFALFAASIFETLISKHAITYIVETSIQVRSALISAVCRKSLKLSSSARQNYTLGQIMNLVSVDTQRLSNGLVYFVNLWGAPLQVVIAIWLVYRELQISALVGSIGLGVLIPLNIISGKIVKKLEAKQLIAKDTRIKVI